MGSSSGRGLRQRFAAAFERRLGTRRSRLFDRQPRVGLIDQRVHLREQRARRRALGLEHLDPPKAPQNRPCLVHGSNVAGPVARVCVEIVTKGIRFVPSVAASPDRDLGEARAALDRADGRRAVTGLDRARRGYLKHHDAEGLEHVLAMAALVDGADDRTRIARQNLVYAVKQNLRQELRRRARERHEPWLDPFPDLQAPEEHTRLALTGSAKVAIGIGVLAALAIFVGFVLAAALGGETTKTVTLRLVNDTGRSVTVRGCDDPDCATTFMNRELGPGIRSEADVDADTLVQLFSFEQAGAKECLPLRVHDAYQRFGGDRVLAARLSQATPCPGTTVLPRPAEPTPI